MDVNSASAANVAISPEKQENVAGIQVSDGRISDSANGKTSRSEFHGAEISSASPSSSAKLKKSTGANCHQCRQGNRTFLVPCKNLRNKKQCCLKICYSCLWNRYKERPEEVEALADWSCPKCRGICNCSVCERRQGKQPTGVLNKKAKATHENEPKNSRSEGLDGNDLVEEEEVDIPLPVGMELRRVAGIDVHAEDVGNALQFLEFCLVFEEILELKNGEAEDVLREVLHVGAASPARTVRLHIHLLSVLEESATRSPSDEDNSWFKTLQNCFSKTQNFLKAPEVDSLLMAADYDSLNASEKLRVLILLCNEVLGTKKVRNWMENENNKFLEMVKVAKQKAHSAKDKETRLKQKVKEDVQKAIIAKDGAPLSISQHEAIVSLTKSEAAEARAEVLESESMARKSNKTCNALRIEPLFMEHRGNVYWKLNSSDKSYMLQQDVGKGDTLSLDEKWYALDDASREMIEKHVSSRGKRSGKRRAPEASSSKPQMESAT